MQSYRCLLLEQVDDTRRLIHDCNKISLVLVKRLYRKTMVTHSGRWSTEETDRRSIACCQLSTYKVSMELYLSGVTRICPGELFEIHSAGNFVEETWCSCRGLSLVIGIFRQPSTALYVLPTSIIPPLSTTARFLPSRSAVTRDMCQSILSSSATSPRLKRAMRRLSPTRHIPGSKPGVSDQSAYGTTGFNFSKVTTLGNCFADET
jgi:hypothetical protein